MTDIVTGLKLGVNKLQVHVYLMQVMICELLQISGDAIVTGFKLGVNKLQVHVYLMQIMTCELLQISGDDRHCNRSEVKSK